MPSLKDCRCILVIGATAGIGRDLAKALVRLPSKPFVIAAARRAERLEELREWGLAEGEGRLESIKLDVSAPSRSLISAVSGVLQKYPDIDAVVFSAGIQHLVDFTSQPENIDADHLALEMNVNYISIVTMVAKCFIPHFRVLEKQGRPTFLIPISSGLAIFPSPRVPLYCASKAALHNYCVSLAQQLKDTNLHVVEILPPLVESELHDHQGTVPTLSKFWMPLETFTAQLIEQLLSTDGSGFIPIGTSREWYDKFEAGKLANGPF